MLFKALIFRLTLVIFSCSFCFAEEIQKSESQIVVESLVSQWNNHVNKANIDIGIKLISAYIENRQEQMALNLADKFLQLKSLSEVKKVQLLSKRIKAMRDLKQWDNEKNIIIQAQNLIGSFISNSVLSSKDKQYIDALWKQVGLYYYNKGEYQQAEKTLIKSLLHIDKAEYSIHAARLDFIGVVKTQQADYAGAIKYMLMALDIYKSQGKLAPARQYQNLGGLYFYLTQWQKSIEYSEIAIELKNQPSRSKADLYSNIAASYINLKQFKKAETNLLESIRISKIVGSDTGSSRINLGTLYRNQKHYEKALIQLELSEQEYQKAEKHTYVANAIKEQAKVYFILEKYGIAAQKYQLAYDMYKKFDLKPKRVELYPHMIENLEKLGNNLQALKLMHEFKTISDEISSTESIKVISELENAYELANKNKKLAELELLKEQQNKSINQLKEKQEYDRLIRLLMIVLVIGFAIIILLLFRSWRFRGKANQLLSSNNKHIQEQHQELNKLNLELKNQSEIDPLTQLNNRRYLSSFVNSYCLYSNNLGQQWILILIDIDYFKHVNDRHGHPIGDIVLKEFADNLNKVKADDDILVRWGGEEFLWLVNCDNINKAQSFCKKFQDRLSGFEFGQQNSSLKITCSMGFYPFKLNLNNLIEWEFALKVADIALYKAKNSGRDTWIGYRPNSNLSNKDLITDIDKLIKNNKILEII